MSARPEDRALADYRREHPEDDDLPDEVVAKLLVVNLMAFSYALRDFGHALLDAFKANWHLVLLAWVLVVSLALFFPE